MSSEQIAEGVRCGFSLPAGSRVVSDADMEVGEFMSNVQRSWMLVTN